MPNNRNNNEEISEETINPNQEDREFNTFVNLMTSPTPSSAGAGGQISGNFTARWITGIDFADEPSTQTIIEEPFPTELATDPSGFSSERLEIIMNRIGNHNRSLRATLNSLPLDNRDRLRILRQFDDDSQYATYDDVSESNIPLERGINIERRRFGTTISERSYNFREMVNDIVMKKSPKDESIDGFVYTVEDPKTKISINKCTYISGLGYFKLGDKRLVEDYLYKGTYVLLDTKYPLLPRRVFTEITKDGKLICNNTLTNRYSGKGACKDIEKTILLPKIYNPQNGDVEYVTFNLSNDETFKKYYTESLENGIYYETKPLSKEDLNWLIERQYKVRYRKYKGETGAFLESISKLPNTYINTFGKRYQFGIEIETISGFLPEYLDNDLYYSAVHDGSLRDPETGDVYGGEYVTDILQGDLGLQQLKKLCYQLTKRCLVDKKCGNHVHLSGVDFNKENIILMYWLYSHIQDEVFKMMPKSRRKNEYCRKLEPININISNISPENKNRNYYIDTYYSEIILFLSKKDYNNKNINKKHDHPKGFKCNYDHSTARYCWVNFIPSVFNTRGNEIYTIEFRPMSASTSYRKIKNWLLICMALVDVIENNKQFVYANASRGISLNDIIEISYPKNFTKLVKYIDERKDKFSENSNTKTETDDYQDNEKDDDFKLKNL